MPEPNDRNSGDIVVQHLLKQRLFRYECPDEETIIAYALKDLPWERRAALKQHTESCPRCSEEIEVTQKFLVPPPPRVFSLWETVERFIASLFTELPAVAPEGSTPRLLRAASKDEEGKPSSETYAVERIKITLTREENQPGWIELSGLLEQQITDNDPSPPLHPIAVRLLRITENQPPEPAAEVPIERGQFFALPPVSMGMYRLEVLFSDRLIEIGLLRL